MRRLDTASRCPYRVFVLIDLRNINQLKDIIGISVGAQSKKAKESGQREDAQSLE